MGVRTKVMIVSAGKRMGIVGRQSHEKRRGIDVYDCRRPKNTGLGIRNKTKKRPYAIPERKLELEDFYIKDL